MKLLTIVIAALIFSNCGEEEAKFASNSATRPEKIPAQIEKSEDATAIAPIAPIEEEKNPEETFGFKASTTQEDDDTKVRLVFVIDNSFSMKDNIAKLRDSMAGLFKLLGERNIKFGARILTMDMLIKQLEVPEPEKGIEAPRQIFGGLFPNYNRTVDTPYAAVNEFSSAQEVGLLLKSFDNIINDNEKIANEPGLCLAADYINWNIRNTDVSDLRFVDQEKIHFIFLSGEDHSRTINIFDEITGAVKSSNELICYQEKVEDLKCQMKYTDKFSWKEHCYDWTTSRKQAKFKYEINYKKKSKCEKAGLAADSTSGNIKTHNLAHLEATQRCGRYRQTCTSKTKVKNYSCNSASSSKIYRDDITNSLKSCEEAQIFSCKNKFQCKTSFSCKIMVDGQPIWVDKTLDQAFALKNKGGTCTIKGDLVEVNALKKVAYTSKGAVCEEAAAPFETVARNEAISIIGSNGTCNASNNDADWLRKDVLSDNVVDPGVRSCESYTCSINEYDDVPVYDHELNAAQHDLASCKNRELVNTEDRVHITTAANSQVVNDSFSLRSCSDFGTGYVGVDIAPSKYPLGNNYCKANIDLLTLPSYVSVVNTSATVTSNMAETATLTYNSPRTLAQLAAALRVSVSDINGTPVLSEYEVDVNTNFTNQCYTFPQGPDFEIGKQNFVARPVTEYLDIAKNSSKIPPAGDHYRVGDVKTNRVFGADGKHFANSGCNGKFLAEKHTKSEPEAIYNLIRDLHPLKTFTFHSVVNQDGNSCANITETNVSEGKDYKALSKITGGASFNICQSNFAPFVDILAKKVAEAVNLIYPIPDALKGMQITSILNKTKHTKLLLDTHFRIIEDNIVFSPGVFESGHSIEVIISGGSK